MLHFQTFFYGKIKPEYTNTITYGVVPVASSGISVKAAHSESAHC